MKNYCIVSVICPNDSDELLDAKFINACDTVELKKRTKLNKSTIYPREEMTLNNMVGVLL